MKKNYFLSCRIAMLFAAVAFALNVSAQATFYIENNNPDEWPQIALYSWDASSGTNVEAFGGWPGVVLFDGENTVGNDAVTVAKDGNRFTVTLANHVSTQNLILNNNNNGKQFDLTEFADGKTYEIAAPADAPTSFSTTIYFVNDNQSVWTAVALYNWGGNGEIYGGWPGVVLVNQDGSLNPNGNKLVQVEYEGQTVDGYYVYKIGLGDDTGFENLIFNNNGQGQQFDVALENGAYYNTGGKATAITSTSLQGTPHAVVYNLNGQRVAPGFKGIAVQNGRKVVSK